MYQGGEDREDREERIQRGEDTERRGYREERIQIRGHLLPLVWAAHLM